MLWNRSPVSMKWYVTLFFMTTLLFFGARAEAQTDPAKEEARQKEKVDRETRRFLKALQEAGYYDVGIFYLEKNKDSLPEDVQETYDFQLASMRMSYTSMIADNTQRLAELDKAIALFLKFMKEHPKRNEVNIIRELYPKILFGQAGYDMQRANLPDVPAADKKQYMESARKTLATAEQFLTEEDKKVTEENKAYEAEWKNYDAKYRKLNEELRNRTNDPGATAPISREDQQEITRLTELRQSTSNLANHMRYNLANVVYETANTYEKGSKEYADKLEEARAKFSNFWVRYAETRALVAYQGRLREGEILVEQKKIEGRGNALEVLKDLSNALSGDEFPGLYSAALGAYFMCFVEKAPTPDEWDEARQAFTKWSRTPDVDKTAKYSLDTTLDYARMLGAQAKRLKEDDPERAKLTDEVSKLLVPMLKRFEPHRYNINLVLKEYAPQNVKEESDLTMENYHLSKSYEEVMKFVNKLTREYSDKQKLYRAETDPTKREALRMELEKIARSILPVHAYLETLKDSMLGDTNKTTLLLDQRYRRAGLLNAAGYPLDATVVYDMIAFRYTASPLANPAMDAMSQLYAAMLENRVNEMIHKEKSLAEAKTAVMYELQSLVKVMEAYAAKKKLTEDDKTRIESGWQRVCRCFVLVGDVKNAMKYLERIPDASPFRSDAEGQVGGAIWKAYNADSRAEESKKLFTQEEAKQWREDSLKLLDSSYKKQQEAVKKGKNISSAMVGAIVQLCQIYNQAGQMTKTMEVLQNPTIGPYTLLKNDSPAAQPNKQAILSAALQAFVSENDTAEAEKVMNRLDELAKAESQAGGNANTRLTQMYLNLGRGLEESLQQMKAEGDTEMMGKVQKGFEMFLERIMQRDAKYSTLTWIAQTYVSLGDGLMDTKGRKRIVSPAAKKYYEAAVTAYKRIIDLCKADPSFSGSAKPEALLDGLNKRLAETYVKAGDSTEGLNIYVELLRDGPNNIDLQVEAANIMWDIAQNADDKDPKKKIQYLIYTQAGMFKEYIKPGDKTKTKDNIIYGWARLFKTTKDFKLEWTLDTPALMKKPEMSEAFYNKRRGQQFLSVLRMAEISVELSKLYDTPEKKKDSLSKAQGYIESLYRLYGVNADGTPRPSAFGDLYNEFDETYREIQLLQKVPKAKALGLQSIETVKIDPLIEDKEAPLADIKEDADRAAELEQYLAEEEIREKVFQAAAEEQAKPTDPVLLYSIVGVTALVMLGALFFMMRRRKPSRAELHRREEMATTEFSEIPTGETSPEFQAPVKIEGVTDDDAVVPGEASTELFASLGIGDAPAGNVDGDMKIDFFASPEEKKAAALAARRAAQKPTTRPGEKSASPDGKKPVSPNGKKPLLKRPAPKDDAKSEDGDAGDKASDEASPKPTVKRIIKPVVKKPESSADPAPKPDADASAAEPEDET